MWNERCATMSLILLCGDGRGRGGPNKGPDFGVGGRTSTTLCEHGCVSSEDRSMVNALTFGAAGSGVL